MRRTGENNPFPSIPLIQSVKLWQKSYFYMKNVAPQGNFVNLPAYVAGPPASRPTSWSFRAKTLSQAGNAAVARLRVMAQSEGLVGSDLVVAFVDLVAAHDLSKERPLRPMPAEHRGDASRRGVLPGELHPQLQARRGLAIRQGAVLSRKTSACR